MTEEKKLNLSAMVKKDTHDLDVTKDEKKSEVKNENTTPLSKPGIKINLSSIKTDKKPEIKPVVKPEEPKKESEKTQDEKTFDSLTSRVETKNIPNTQERKLKISALKSPIAKKNNTDQKNENQIEEKKQKIETLKKPLENLEKNENDPIELGNSEISEKKKITIQKVQNTQESEENLDNLSENEKYEDENAEVFSNYESDFKKKESKVLDGIQKLKEIANIKKMSKTNKIFIFSIIGLTVIGVSFLVYLEPNKHTLENYKASILTLAGKQMTQEEIETHQGDIQKEIDWQLEENNLGGYDLGFEILVNEQGEAVYKFDGVEYNSKNELDRAIEQKLEVLKKDRIREYFKKENNTPLIENSEL